MPEGTAPVITFYSYKGGSGRSLAIMQFAACLAHFGKNVALVDLDLDSPSLHHKLSFLQSWVHEVPVSKDGIAGVLQDGVASARELNYLKKCTTCGQPALREVKEGMKLLLEVGADRFARLRSPTGEGSISLLMSGLPTHEVKISSFIDASMTPIWRYWNTFYDRETQMLFNHSTEFGDAFVGLVRQLKEGGNKTLDYILIDASSGNSPLSHIATHTLADRLVAFTCYQEESVAGTAMMLSSVPKDLEVSVVVSKVPSEYRNRFMRLKRVTEEQVGFLKDDVLKDLQRAMPRIQRNSLFVLRLDPLLSFQEHLPIPLVEDKHATHSLLVEDYLELFRALLDPDENESFDNHFQSYLQSELEEIRLFHLLTERGLLINPNDESRNVAMRADTLGSLMQILASKQDGFEDKLSEAGFRAAQRFTDALVELWSQQGESRELEPLDRIRKWCEFDSTVGFGRFSVTEDSSASKGRVVLRDNFLLHGRTSEDPNLCHFWIGYLTTVLRGITGNPDLHVSHPRSSCGQRSSDSSHTCVFQYSELQHEARNGNT